MKVLLCLKPPFFNFPLCPGRFWHITDLHLDPSYHMSPDPTKVCLSSQGDPVTHAGVFGDFLCDSPYSLIQSAFAHMAPLTQPEDFIIWTGLVGHGAEGGADVKQSNIQYSQLIETVPVALKHFHNPVLTALLPLFTSSFPVLFEE